MKFINPTREYLLGKFREEITKMTEEEKEDALSEIWAEFTKDRNWITRIKESKLTDDLTVSCSPAIIDGLILEEFEMIVTARFDYEGYKYFSDGTHAVSLDLLIDDMLECMKIIEPEGAPNA